MVHTTYTSLGIICILFIIIIITLHLTDLPLVLIRHPNKLFFCCCNVVSSMLRVAKPMYTFKVVTGFSGEWREISFSVIEAQVWFQIKKNLYTFWDFFVLYVHSMHWNTYKTYITYGFSLRLENNKVSNLRGKSHIWSIFGSSVNFAKVKG